MPQEITRKSQVEIDGRKIMSLVMIERRHIIKLIDLVMSPPAGLSLGEANLIVKERTDKVQSRFGRHDREWTEGTVLNRKQVATGQPENWSGFRGLGVGNPYCGTRLLPLRPYCFNPTDDPDNPGYGGVPLLAEFEARVNGITVPRGKNAEWVANHEREKIIGGQRSAIAFLVFVPNDPTNEQYKHLLMHYDRRVRARTTGNNTAKVLDDIAMGVRVGIYTEAEGKFLRVQLQRGKFSVLPIRRAIDNS
jgi:hypothetical protein